MTTLPINMRDHWYWRPGWGVGRRFWTWHLTFEEQDDVHRLAAEYRSQLAPLGSRLTLIPDRWLHCTMQGIGFVGETAQADVDAVVAGARDRLAAVPAFDAEIGPATVDEEAVILPLRPGQPVQDVRNAIRTAIGDVLPEVPESADGFFPHMSVAYNAEDGPSAPVVEALSSRKFQAARARITAARLIVIHRDRQMYEWETYASVPLSGHRPSMV
ncbi:2'-5' RNA ligase family protein [Streptomyces sp. NPDC094468]|uniref:2'-5' RNA ligase family protein n=1 Tax=Streptomyces sp. NPDC094468 TaxID=3366066 RepID=UPI00381B2F24